MEKILFIGGDSRNIEVIDRLSKKGYEIALIGFDHYDFSNQQIALLDNDSIDFALFDTIILPVQGTSADGKVNCPYADEPFQLTETMISQTPTHCKILSGIANDFLKNATKDRQLETIFARDDVAIYNSISTAEATLQLAIEHTDYTIHGANISVLGFGRVGFTVAKLFYNVGANVTVFVRNNRDLARIDEMGMNGHKLDGLTKEVNNYSICVNTIPHPILNKDILTEIKRDMLILDLASAPGGTDFQFAKEKGLHAIHALGLPGKTASKSAGEVLANTILDILNT